MPSISTANTPEDSTVPVVVNPAAAPAVKARALINGGARLRNLPAVSTRPFDRQCYYLSKSGKSPEEIAGLMNAHVDEVNLAVLSVEQWKHANSRDMVEAAMNEQAMIAIAPIGKTLSEAQRARRMVRPPQPEVRDVDGNLIAPATPAMFEPDHATRIDAVRAAAEVVGSVREKGPAVAVNVGVQNNIGGVGRSFEERLRAKRQEMGMVRPDRQLSTGASNVGGERDLEDEDIIDGEVDDEMDDELDDEVEVGDDGDGDGEDYADEPSVLPGSSLPTST